MLLEIMVAVVVVVVVVGVVYSIAVWVKAQMEPDNVVVKTTTFSSVERMDALYAGYLGCKAQGNEQGAQAFKDAMEQLARQ